MICLRCWCSSPACWEIGTRRTPGTPPGRRETSLVSHALPLPNIATVGELQAEPGVFLTKTGESSVRKGGHSNSTAVGSPAVP